MDRRKHPTKQAEHGPAKKHSSDQDLQSTSASLLYATSVNNLSDIFMFLSGHFYDSEQQHNFEINSSILSCLTLCWFAFFIHPNLVPFEGN